jgi:hypothetical protein
LHGFIPSLNPRREFNMASRGAQTATSSGISMGGALAIAISWTQYHSLLWAILHGIFGWLYVIYFAFKSGRL